jgi:hypothetical protein
MGHFSPPPRRATLLRQVKQVDEGAVTDRAVNFKRPTTRRRMAGHMGDLHSELPIGSLMFSMDGVASTCVGIATQQA